MNIFKRICTAASVETEERGISFFDRFRNHAVVGADGTDSGADDDDACLFSVICLAVQPDCIRIVCAVTFLPERYSGRWKSGGERRKTVSDAGASCSAGADLLSVVFYPSSYVSGVGRYVLCKSGQ